MGEVLARSEPVSRRGGVSVGENECSEPQRAPAPESSGVLLSGPRRFCPAGEATQP